MITFFKARSTKFLVLTKGRNTGSKIDFSEIKETSGGESLISCFPHSF